MATITCCGETCVLPRSIDLRGLLGFWLLWELRLGPLLGAQIAERMEWRRGEPLSPGTLYPALAALGRDGLVHKSRAGRDTSYRLTPKGRTELNCAGIYVRAVFRDVFAAKRGPSPLQVG
ncbi:MAG: PadR family transcriptional regulator [Euryarchaeota archaeon]|nr:PadR family transcriptional regulator [Euryarchaeota archaeon]